MGNRVAFDDARMSGLWEVCFGARVELLGVVRGLKVETSEGTFPVMAVKDGVEFCVIAGALVLSDSNEGNRGRPCWIYLGRRDVGLEAAGVRRFGSVQAIRDWVTTARSTAFHRALTEMIVL